jgi:membrane protein YdbS with pleckstrin-like domain
MAAHGPEKIFEQTPDQLDIIHSMPPENPGPAPAAPPPSAPPAPTPVAEPSPAIQKADTEMLEPGEHIVTIVHRHPIGIVAIYIETFVGIITLVVLTMVLARGFFQDLSGETYRLFLAGVIVGIMLLALILFVATYIYRQSRLIVSDKSLIQILQKGLFIRKISRLSMSNVQDVSAEHNGFLPTIFGYGTLTVETAGEEDNFTFPYCPTPDTYAERILEARQKYIQSLDDGARP